jgi:hypothetical protein
MPTRATSHPPALLDRLAGAPPVETTSTRASASSLDLAGEVRGLAVGATLASSVAAASAIADGHDAGAVARRAARASGKTVVRGAAVRAVAVGIEKGILAVAVREGATGAGRRATLAVAAREGGKAIAKQAAKQGPGAVLKATLRGNVIGAMAGLIVDQAVDTARLARGGIDRDEYGRRSAENAGSAGGGFAGAGVGATIGTMIVPGLGTAVGALIGGLAGSLGGLFGARALVR